MERIIAAKLLTNSADNKIGSQETHRVRPGQANPDASELFPRGRQREWDFNMVTHKKDRVVEIGHLVVESQPGVRLVTPPLGTCIAVALHDPCHGIGGVLHAMLPESSLDEPRSLDQPALFVDTGLQALVAEFTRCGGVLEQARVHAAGGMDLTGGETVYDLGRRNRRMLLNLLPVLGLTLESSKLGGYTSVSMALDLETGQVTTRRAGENEGVALCKK